MIENTVTYDYTERDLQLNGGTDNDLSQLNNHPEVDGIENNYYLKKFSGIIMASGNFLDERGKKTGIKAQKPKIETDGQITIEELPLFKKNIRVNLGDNEVIGLTPNGKDLLYKGDDPGEIYKMAHKIDNSKLNLEYVAYISKSNFDWIRKILRTKDSNEELLSKLVAFKSHTSIYIDGSFDSIRLGKGDILAINIDKNQDNSENPFNTERYVYLANLDNNPKSIERKHTTIIDKRVKHPINFPITRGFFADHRDAVETKFSLPTINKSGISRRD